MQEKKTGRNKKIISTIFKFLVSAGILYFLLYITRLENLRESITKISFLSISVAVSLYFASLYFSTKRWQILLKNLAIDVADGELYKSYLIGAFFNNFLPSSIGGDVSKVFTVNVPNEQRVKFGASIVAERLAGVITNLILGVLFGIFLLKDDSSITIVWLILLALLVTALLFFFVQPKMKVPSKILDLIPTKFLKKFSSLAGDIFSLKLTASELLPMFFYSVLICLTSVISLNFYFRDLDYPMLLSPLFFMISSTMILSLIPISLNSIGIKEFGYVAILGLYGINKADSLTIALVSRVLLIACSLLGGVLVLIKKRQDQSETNK